MITFLIINACGITLVPTTIISLRMLYKSSDPSIIVLPCMLISFLSMVFGLIINRVISK